MKKLGIVFVCALCALPVCAAGNRQNKNDIRVVLDWTPNTNHTGIYVALERGYFSDAGLQVSIVQPPEDGALLLVAAGNAEFGIDFQETLGPAIAKKSDALPLTAVAAIINHNTSGIMSLANSGINRPKDLAGKRFASWETPFYTAIIRTLVSDDGGDFNAVKMIPNNATDAFSALETDIDAIWIYYAWDAMAAAVNGTNIAYLDIGQLNPVFDFYTPVIVANTDFIAKNPDIIRQFLGAVSRGYQDAISDPAAAARILLKHAPELDPNLVIRSQEYLASRYKGDSYRWGEIDPVRWNRFYDWMYRNNLVETTIVGRGFSNEFLPE
ncbi:nitrate ABC transporter substrate-binding protein [Spirochaetia bacterium]|nr:nitrate ABC transporter substrate-binding protein [Spirochaetia bacterium]GHU29980.1 nitrate ABC transporter substrate-binding protein [Spirochaetia bacterium]